MPEPSQFETILMKLGKHDEMFERLTSTVEQVLIEQRKTNGRVTALERSDNEAAARADERAKILGEVAKKQDHSATIKMWAVGLSVGAVLTIVTSLVAVLANHA